jgi:hypothetical protein
VNGRPYEILQLLNTSPFPSISSWARLFGSGPS